MDLGPPRGAPNAPQITAVRFWTMKVSAFVSAQHRRSASLTEGSFIDDGEGAEEEAEGEECRNEEVCCVSLRPFDRFAQKPKQKRKEKEKERVTIKRQTPKG
jgi:hypothetical protein